jgi:hypothetical protein
MHNGLTPVQEIIQELVETLINSGVVCKTAADGELLLELYSLLNRSARHWYTDTNAQAQVLGCSGKHVYESHAL